ncbi:MAG: hypothetical protein PHN49_01240 [Candidatus Omnitrophica bacterium]|nr:hypothetical protein [Candidatus Omnitrophota bacterium]
MNSKQLAREFVLPYFNLRESLFDAAWDYIAENFDKVSATLSSGSGQAVEKADIPLSIGGEEQRGALKAIIIFADGFKEMPIEGSFADLVDSIKSACGKYHAEAGLAKEILKKVSSLENRIEKFMKPQAKGKAIVKEKEDDLEGYVIYLSKDKGIGTETFDASKSRVEKDYLENKEAYDIFVYTRSTYSKRRDAKSGKHKLMLVELDQRMYVLLVLFLKHKDSCLDVYALHKKAWDHVPKDYDGRPDYKKTMEYLKSTISGMKSKIDVDALEIKKFRNSEGYICTGNFKFCAIIDKSQSKKFSLSDFDIKDTD